MSDYEVEKDNKYNPEFDKKSKDEEKVCIDACKKEVRADLTVKEEKHVKIWGQVKNQCCEPVENAFVTLAKLCKDEYGKMKHKEIATTTTDCKGMYSFTVCADDHACYKVFACKPPKKPCKY